MKRPFLLSSLCAALWACFPGSAAGADLFEVGPFVKIYDQSVGEKEKWYINDHCFIRAEDGTWHLFGITHQEPMNPLDEDNFAHATGERLLQRPWKKLPFALSAVWDPWKETHLWAPHVIRHKEFYYMFYCAGGPDHKAYRIHLAISRDLKTWKRHPRNPMVVDGYDARDPFVMRIGNKWVMYYTATSEPAGGNHVVACVTSDDLVTWKDKWVVFKDPSRGTCGGPTESPFVVRRGDYYYLFIGPRGGYDGTDVFRSTDPFNWSLDDKVGHINAHAAEVVRDTDGKWYVSRCGWGRGGVYLAPLKWKEEVEKKGSRRASSVRSGGSDRKAEARGGAFKAAAAVRIITPDPLLPVSGGLGPTHPVKEKRGELAARALVLEKGDTRVGIVSLDLLGFPSVLCDRVRRLVPRIPAENIIIGSTHTHSAPDCYAFPDGKGGHTGDLDYMSMVCRKTAEALNEAVDKLARARLKIATGEARGRIAYNYYAPDLYDRRVSVIQAVSPEGRTIATLVNYAVHPEVLGPRAGFLSPDLVGPLYRRVEERVGGTALFMNGAQGGMVTADNRDLERARDPLRAVWEDENTWEECVRIGTTLADEALRIVKDAPVQENPGLFCRALEVDFPVESDLIWAVVVNSPLRYPHGTARTITTRLNLINLGNAQILTIPGEALPNIGFYLKRKMRGEHNLLFGLTNDAFGYIMTKVDYKSFTRYDYISRTSLGELTGEILIENALELVERSPRPEPLRAGR